jgi:hypothetical protein
MSKGSPRWFPKCTFSIFWEALDGVRVHLGGFIMFRLMVQQLGIEYLNFIFFVKEYSTNLKTKNAGALLILLKSHPPPPRPSPQMSGISRK